MSRNGEAVSAFERELAAYCGAKWAIAAANGTVTLQAALVALGVKPGDRVAVPPLTMAATTIAVLNVGAVPVFWDVAKATWLMSFGAKCWRTESPGVAAAIPVSLYGLSRVWETYDIPTIDDAAQTLRKHSGCAFTSLSFQASKILPLGEGGALLTNDDTMAEAARSYLSLGYRMDAGQARIDPASLKSPTFARHHRYPAINGRMNDLTARAGLALIASRDIDFLKQQRLECVGLYFDAISDCDWLTPQHVPDGWTHDYWAFAVATDTPERLLKLLDAVEKHGGERPFPCWRLTYQEPALAHLVTPSRTAHGDPLSAGWYDAAFGAPAPGICPVAESLQPRIAQAQTNNLASAERNAKAWRRAIEDLS